jgi:hypothetical protein
MPDRRISDDHPLNTEIHYLYLRQKYPIFFIIPDAG